MKPEIKKEHIKPLFESRFINVYDLQYADNMHYFDATRRKTDDLMAIKSDKEFKQALPDAVTCIVILKNIENEPKLLLNYEYRYPAGRFLLSPPAGLLDFADKNTANPVLSAAKREIEEETGIVLSDSDRLFTVNPLLFSTPGMTDESNALICAVVDSKDSLLLSQDGAEGSECFNGFELVTKEAAKNILLNGKDKNGIFYSVFTWAVLMYFISDLWNEE